jgi:hypothetical protein
MKEVTKKQKEDGILLQVRVDDTEKESEFFMKERYSVEEKLLKKNIEAL